MTANVCWGVYRELAHSPGRETDDALILRATGDRLAAMGWTVEMRTPEELMAAADVPPFLFVMCERLPVLERLAACERDGAVVVNPSEGIRNTYRDRTIDRFVRDGVAFPRSALVATGASGSAELPVKCPLWVKRGDVHATQEGDVAFARDGASAAEALRAFAERGIARAVVQEHVPGDLLKFYGVGTAPAGGVEPWFTWFYHRGQAVAGHAFAEEELRAAARKAAASLGLAVFGGDAIVTSSGSIVVIDLNAWPSFALYRDVASRRIAEYLASRFTSAGAVAGLAGGHRKENVEV